MRAVDQIKAELDTFEAQFIRTIIEPGTPDRKRLQREADDALHRQRCLPQHTAKRVALFDELRAAQTHAKRSVSAKRAAARRAADPTAALRRRVLASLRRMGFVRENTSGKSAYYIHVRAGLSVRVSDHEVPMSAERSYNRDNGGFTWSESGYSFMIAADTEPREAGEWLVWIRNTVRSKEQNG